ncbi:hypothetical protein AOLI_G00131780 [Acnodon oligacanthus]
MQVVVLDVARVPPAYRLRSGRAAGRTEPARKMVIVWKRRLDVIVCPSGPLGPALEPLVLLPCRLPAVPLK